MGAVAERFLGRRAAATKRHALLHRKFVSIGVDQFHFARYDVRAVLDCLDCYLNHNINLTVISTEVERSLDISEMHQRFLDFARNDKMNSTQMKMFAAITFLASSLLAQPQSPSGKHPFTFEDMMALKRVGAPVPSPDGKWVVFVSAVYPDCKDDVCNKQRDEELKKSKMKAKIFSRLFYRHWNAFTEFKRSHLFVIGADARADRSTDILSVGPAGVSPAESQPPDKMSRGPTGKMPVLQASAAPRDLTPGDHDVPPFHLGGADMYSILPPGQEGAYTWNIDEVEATSTNNEIFIVPISGPASAGKKISTSPGADTTPLYSPDGKYLAWRSQARAGFEADKWSLMLYERESGRLSNLTPPFDRSIGSFASRVPFPIVLFTAEDHGESPPYAVLTPIPDPQ